MIKRKAFLYLTIILIMLFAVPPSALAHPGGTDSNGGHYDRSTGEYHYHHGYPAHLHENGVCPYDFDDKTGQSSGSSSSSSGSSPGSSKSASSSSTSTTKTYTIDTSSAATKANGPNYMWPFIIGAGACIIVAIATRKVTKRKNEQATRDTANEVKKLKRKIASLQAEKEIQEKKNKAEYKRALKAEQEKEEIGRRYNNFFHSQLAKVYGRKTKTEIALLVGMPQGLSIGTDNLPYDNNGEGKWGSCTRYISPTGRACHAKPNCNKAAYQEVNMIEISRQPYSPCKKCCPPLVDTSWYERYTSLIKLLDQYKIPIK